jgi:hypothetical protein
VLEHLVGADKNDIEALAGRLMGKRGRQVRFSPPIKMPPLVMTFFR